jgi:hypothetical protein
VELSLDEVHWRDREQRSRREAAEDPDSEQSQGAVRRQRRGQKAEDGEKIVRQERLRKASGEGSRHVVQDLRRVGRTAELDSGRRVRQLRPRVAAESGLASVELCETPDLAERVAGQPVDPICRSSEHRAEQGEGPHCVDDRNQSRFGESARCAPGGCCVARPRNRGRVGLEVPWLGSLRFSSASLEVTHDCAHVGIVSLLLASIVGSAGEVHAFEPVPANFARLDENVRLNGFENIVLSAMYTVGGSVNEATAP